MYDYSNGLLGLPSGWQITIGDGGVYTYPGYPQNPGVYPPVGYPPITTQYPNQQNQTLMLILIIGAVILLMKK